VCASTYGRLLKRWSIVRTSLGDTSASYRIPAPRDSFLSSPLRRDFQRRGHLRRFWGGGHHLCCTRCSRGRYAAGVRGLSLPATVLFGRGSDRARSGESSASPRTRRPGARDAFCPVDRDNCGEIRGLRGRHAGERAKRKLGQAGQDPAEDDDGDAVACDVRSPQLLSGLGGFDTRGLRRGPDDDRTGVARHRNPRPARRTWRRARHRCRGRRS
jgi:hypothetical protein